MPLVLKLTRIGNSQGLILPKTLLAQIDVGVGDKVALTVRDGKIYVSKAGPIKVESFLDGRLVAENVARHIPGKRNV